MKKISRKSGLPPGSLIHIGEKKSEEIRIRVIECGQGRVEERELPSIDAYVRSREKGIISWLNIDGLHHTQVIEKVGELFQLHPLTLEDIVNTEQNPKIEDYDSYLFIVLKMFYYSEKDDLLETEQVSFCLGPDYVLSFQEEAGKDVFEHVRSMLRSDKGKIRSRGSDYLMYALIDATVDSYFGVLEKLGEKTEVLEDEVVQNPAEKTLHEIYRLKKALIFLRKSVSPLREVINNLQRGQSELVHDSTYPYLRDVYDHSVRLIETIETYRDILSGFLDIYMSSLSNRTNAVMKVLTVIATIFMPLTFIAGIYGMNFKYMPELEWSWGYPASLIFMAAIAGLMLLYFRTRKWL